MGSKRKDCEIVKIPDGIARISMGNHGPVIEVSDSLSVIKQELDKYIPLKYRSALIETNGFKLVVDVMDLDQYKEYRLYPRQR